MAFRGRKNANGDYGGTYQKRTAWTAEEDEILKQQVARFGTHCWPEVAAGLTGRTSKACSLRWRCFLSPHIIRPNDEPFSPWEIAVIVLTQRAFGNKWNDIAAYLPMRCNNDIKNYFNLYLKDKNAVFSENCYLRSGYDLTQLLQAEPDDVAQRRQKLEADKVVNNNIPPLKASHSMPSVPRKPSTPTKSKKTSGPGTPTIRGGVTKGTGAKPSRMGTAALAVMSGDYTAYGLEQSYTAAYGDASSLYSADMVAAAASQAYLEGSHLGSQAMYGTTAGDGYFSGAGMNGSVVSSMAAGYGCTSAEGINMQLAQSASFMTEQQQGLQQQHQCIVASDMNGSMSAAAAATVCGLEAAGFHAGSVYQGHASGSDCGQAAEPRCGTDTPTLMAPRTTPLQHSSPGCTGAKSTDSDMPTCSPIMRFSIGDPDNLLASASEHLDPIAAAIGVHWQRITSMDGTEFDSLLSEHEPQQGCVLKSMLGDFDAVSSKSHSNAGAAAASVGGAGTPRRQNTQQALEECRTPGSSAAALLQDLHMDTSAEAEVAAAAAAATAAAAAAAAHVLGNTAVSPKAAGSSLAAAPQPLAGAGHGAAAPLLHVDVPSPTASCGPPSGALTGHACMHQPTLQPQAAALTPSDVSRGIQGALGSNGTTNRGSSSSGGSMSPSGTAHLSHVNINLGLLNPAITHLVAGGDRNATSAPCTMVAAYTPSGSGVHSPLVPRGAFTQGQAAGLPQGWQQQQQQHAASHLSQMPRQQPSPFNDVQHQQQQLPAIRGGWEGASLAHRPGHCMLQAVHSTSSSHMHVHLHPGHQQHLRTSSLLGSPASPLGPAGSRAQSAFAETLQSSAGAWVHSPAGQQQQHQQPQAGPEPAAAAAAINAVGHWSPHSEGPLHFDVGQEEVVDLTASLFDMGPEGCDLGMNSTALDAAPGVATGCGMSMAGDNAAHVAHPTGSLLMCDSGRAVAQSPAKIESLFDDLRADAADGVRIGVASLPESGDLMDLPAWGSSNNGSLDLLGQW